MTLAAPVEAAERARAGLYRLLGAALSHPPSMVLLAAFRGLPAQDGESAVGVALAAVARAAVGTTLEAARREYDALFVGVARGELVPYASFYLTGFLHDRPLVRLREELDRLGLATVEGWTDPEDHAGTVCELMAGLIDGVHGAQQPLQGQQRFFDRHLVPWLPRFFADLAAAGDAGLYGCIGALGAAFLAVETVAFGMED